MVDTDKLANLQVNYLNDVNLTKGKAIPTTEGHESKSNETLLGIVGLFLTFTIVKMKEPNKSL